MIFFLHLSLVWFFLKVIVVKSQSIWMRYAGVGILSVMVLWNVSLGILELRGYEFSNKDLELRNRNRHQPTTVEYMRALANVVPRDSIIMAPQTLAWPVPTFVGKVVSGIRPNPMVRDGAQRQKDVRMFFNATATLEDRLKIIRQYHVTHILYDANKATPELNAELSAIRGVRTSIFDLTLVTLPDAS